MWYFVAKEGLFPSEKLYKQKKSVTPITPVPKKKSSKTKEMTPRLREERNQKLFMKKLKVTTPTGEEEGFTPIGLFKPLKITIHNVYTGSHPNPFFKKKCAVLITTAIKKEIDTKSNAWAVNYLRQDVGVNTFLGNPAASEIGTPIVYYSSALTDKKLIIDFCMMFDEFPGESFKQISDGMTTIGSLPFVIAATPYAAAISAVGKILQTIAELVEYKVDSKHDFFVSEDFNFASIGKKTSAGFFIVLEDNRTDKDQDTFPDEYTLDDDFCLRNKTTGKLYDGECPYLIIGIDGAEDKDLNNFESYTATAEMLNQYFGNKETQEKGLNKIIQGATYATDAYYRTKFDKIDTEIAKLPKDTPQEKKDKLIEERDAYAKNIVNECMKKAE